MNVFLQFQIRRNLLKKMLGEKEVLLFHTRDMMQKGDDDFFHQIDSNFRYFFSNLDLLKCMTCMYVEDSTLQVRLGIEHKSEIKQIFEGKIDFKEIAKQSQLELENVYFEDDWLEFLNEHIKAEHFTKISYYVDDSVTYYSTFKQLLDNLKKEYEDFVKFENKQKEIDEFRVTKDSVEIDCIKKANIYAKEVFEHILQNVSQCSYEYEILSYLSFKTYNLNSFYAFNPIIASGKNATTLHYRKNNAKIGENDLILIDFGCEYDGYKSDITRTFPKNGKFTTRQKEVYEAVLRVQEFAFIQIKAGIGFRDYEISIAKEYGKELVALGLLTQEEVDSDLKNIRKYCPHATSHYLGLDTHDVGSRDQELKERMILTVEPGIYIEEEGIGIRIEDNVLVKKDGCENLSTGIIKTVEEIEGFMKNS